MDPNNPIDPAVDALLRDIEVTLQIAAIRTDAWTPEGLERFTAAMDRAARLDARPWWRRLLWPSWRSMGD